MGWQIFWFIAGHGVAIIIHRNHVVRVVRYVAVAGALAASAAFANEALADHHTFTIPRDAGPNRSELRETLKRDDRDGNVVFHEHHMAATPTLYVTAVGRPQATA